MPGIAKTYTLNTALIKARKYCAYQERSQQEVREKLYGFGLHRNDVEKGIVVLIEEGFLNEQRFAIAFTGGKFRILKWGRVKIRLALKARNVSEPCIKSALKQITDDDYRKTLSKIISERSKKLAKQPDWNRNNLLAQYAINRGYEPDLVWELLKMNE